MWKTVGVIGTDRGCRAFLFTPFVSTTTWYLMLLLRMRIADGRVKEGHAAAYGLGALIIGLPVSLLATLFLAAPAYRVLGNLGRLTAGAALAGGGLIGIAVSLVFWLLEGGQQSWAMPFWQGATIGIVSAACWWGWRGVLWRVDGGTR